MSGDAAAVALGAAVIGSLTTMILQFIRDGQVNRRDVRAAARVIRSEVIRNVSTVQTILVFGLVAPTDDVQIRFTRLDARVDELAVDLPREEIALLVTFLQMTERAAVLINTVKSRVPPSATAQELDWLENTFMPAADFCQVLLDLRGLRAWEILTSPKMWWAFRERRREIVANGFAAPQLDAYLAQHPPQPGQQPHP